MDDPVEPRRRVFGPDRLRPLPRHRSRRRQLGEARRDAGARRSAGRRGDEGRPRRGLRADRRRGRTSPGSILRHPLAALDGYWDYEVPMLEGDFVTDDAGTGFVHMAPSHGADDYELFVKNGLVDRMTHNVLEDFVLRAARPVLRRAAGLRRQGQGGQGQRRRHREAGRGRRARRARQAQAQLPAFLALQGAGDLPQHPAVVRRHRQAARGRHGPVRRHHPQPRADLDRRRWSNGRRRPGATGCTR